MSASELRDRPLPQAYAGLRGKIASAPSGVKGPSLRSGHRFAMLAPLTPASAPAWEAAQASYGLRKELPMFHRFYRPRATLRALTGLDFGLRVRVDVQSSQRSMFCGTENVSARRLISELAEDVSSLRIYSYAMRGQLEEATSALLLNAECGSWRYARRAALDLEDLLRLVSRRRLADADTCFRCAEAASRVADLCAEVR